MVKLTPWGDNPTPIHITIHCRKCDNRLEAYADTLEIALESLDKMKVELEFHMKDDACNMPEGHNDGKDTRP